MFLSAYVIVQSSEFRVQSSGPRTDLKAASSKNKQTRDLERVDTAEYIRIHKLMGQTVTLLLLS